MAVAPTVIGNIQIQALVDANLPVSMDEYLHVKQGTADRKLKISDAIAPHTSRTDNPHQVKKDQVGLGNVTNDKQLTVAGNLSDVANKATARTNLEVYSKAETDAKFVPQVRKINTHALTANINLVPADIGLSNVQNKAPSDSFRTYSDTMATTKAVNDLFKAIQDETPPGTILHTFDPRNPGTYKLCGGTWALMGQGRTLVGFAGTLPTDTPFNGHALKAKFGDSTKLISAANLPAHYHGVNITSGNHTHRVLGTTGGGGAHSHSVTGNTTAYNHGNISARTDGGNSNHQHTGSTSMGGDHYHQYAGDDQLPNHWGIDNWQAARYDAKSDRDHWSKTYRTSTAGAHSHTFATSWSGYHDHGYTVPVGAHQHQLNGTASRVGDHGHNMDFQSQASTVTITGNTASVGSGTAFNVEQPSLVCYIWQRVN